MSLDQFHCYQNAEIQVLNDHALAELPDRANRRLFEHYLQDCLDDFSHDFRDFYAFYLYRANKNCLFCKADSKDLLSCVVLVLNQLFLLWRIFYIDIDRLLVLLIL